MARAFKMRSNKKTEEAAAVDTFAVENSDSSTLDVVASENSDSSTLDVVEDKNTYGGEVLPTVSNNDSDSDSVTKDGENVSELVPLLHNVLTHLQCITNFMRKQQSEVTLIRMPDEVWDMLESVVNGSYTDSLCVNSRKLSSYVIQVVHMLQELVSVSNVGDKKFLGLRGQAIEVRTKPHRDFPDTSITCKSGTTFTGVFY